MKPEIRTWREHLHEGLVIPACPLTLNLDGGWSQQHQRAVIRYYMDAGAGGLAVGVHSTQFAIRDSKFGLFKPILKLAGETIDVWAKRFAQPFVKIAGICGDTQQAVAEAEYAASLGYHAGLLSLRDLASTSEARMVLHARHVAGVLPIIGFYLQPAVGGRVLSYRFWRDFADVHNVVAIKIAPFNRYQTWDVMRAVMESGREDISLYTGNDDNIVVDLLTHFHHAGRTRHIVGGLLGHWGVWTHGAVNLLAQFKVVRSHKSVSAEWLTKAIAVTDMNAALFDAANGFHGCIPGIMEVLRRQGLSPSARCLDPHETLSPGQAEELTRVSQAYPDLVDDDFVRDNLARWLE